MKLISVTTTLMIHILTVIAPLFLIIFASAAVQKWTRIGDDWSTVLNQFALKIGLPILIFSSLARASFSFSEEFPLLIVNTLFLFAAFILAYLLGKILRLKPLMFRTLFICFAFGNVAYLGIPVLTKLYGDVILPNATFIVAIYLFWLFIVGIGYLDYSMERNKKNSLKTIFRYLITNPLLISVILGILAGSLRLKLPAILLQSLDMITASVTPTVLIVIGLFIGKSRIGRLKDWWPVLLFSMVTLFLLPGMFYLGLRIFNFFPAHFSTSILQAAMPLAITPFALADQYQLNKDFIARSIVLSTLLSALSLPFWVFFL